MAKTGILLVNLGTPSEPTPKAVGKYLTEFLMDPRVIDLSWVLRFFLVNVLIVPRRKFLSAKLYEKVWTPSGSPFMAGMKELTQRLQSSVASNISVKFGMRYGTNSIGEALTSFRAEGVRKLTVLPLYPQYSTAATLTSIEKVKKVGAGFDLSFINFFYRHPLFIEAQSETIRKFLNENPFDKLIFSYHGLPERQIKKIALCQSHCFERSDCCEKEHPSNDFCYRFQCFETTRQLVKRLQLPADKYITAFQSRLGRTPWIRPYTDDFYSGLPKQGVKKVVVACPSFTVDCLETLEEVQMRGEETFKANGGESLKLIPCLNAEPHWVEALQKIILEA